MVGEENGENEGNGQGPRGRMRNGLFGHRCWELALPKTRCREPAVAEQGVSGRKQPLSDYHGIIGLDPIAPGAVWIASDQRIAEAMAFTKWRIPIPQNRRIDRLL